MTSSRVTLRGAAFSAAARRRVITRLGHAGFGEPRQVSPRVTDGTPFLSSTEPELGLGEPGLVEDEDLVGGRRPDVCAWADQGGDEDDRNEDQRAMDRSGHGGAPIPGAPD